MGCDTCKQKKEKDYLDINFLPKNVQEGGFENGSFLFKLTAFVVIVAFMPFLISVLIIQMFFHFFLPKSLPKLSKKIGNWFTGLFKKYANYRYENEIKKRKKEFENNLGYEKDSDLVNVRDHKETEDFGDVEVHENNNEEKK
jgi:hypothetical protein